VADLSHLFPDGCAWESSPPSADPEALFPEEQTAVARAVDKRRREFAAGRALARSLLQGLGVSRVAIPAGHDRAPRWPRGFVGSISHCDDLCVVVVAPASVVTSIGVDIEPVGPLSPDVSALVVTDAERRMLSMLDGLNAAVSERIVFSAKESVHKCIYPLVGVTLEFTDIALELRLDPPFEHSDAERTGAFGVRPVTSVPHVDEIRALSGRFVIDEAHVATSAVMFPGSASSSTA